MTSFVFDRWHWRMASTFIGAAAQPSGMVARGLLCMANTTLPNPSEPGIAGVADMSQLRAIETLDEFDGSGAAHTVIPVTLGFVGGTGEISGRTRFLLGDWAPGVLGSGTRLSVGLLAYWDSDGSDTDLLTNWPWFWLQFGTPTDGDGVNPFVVPFHDLGPIYIETPAP